MVRKMITETRCINENSFDMHMYPETGDAWILTNRSGKVTISQVGSLSRDPFVLNRYGGEASIVSHYNISMSLANIQSLAVAEKVYIMERVPANAYATLNLAILNMNSPWFKSEYWCGYAMKKIPPMEGSSVCFETQEELIASMPPVNTPADAPIKLGMDPGLIAKAEMARDFMTICVVLASLAGSARLLCHKRRQHSA